MLAAELRVKKAGMPLWLRQRQTSGYGFWRNTPQTIAGHNQRDHRHAAQQHRDEAGVGVEGGEAGGGDGGRHQAEDAVGRDADDERDDVVDDARGVVEYGFGVGVGVAQGDAGEHRPGKDADVVAVGDGADRVVGDFEEERGQHFFQAARRGDGFGVAAEVECGGEPGAGDDGDCGGGKGAGDIQGR